MKKFIILFLFLFISDGYSQDFFGLSFPVPDVTGWQDTTIGDERLYRYFDHDLFHDVTVSNDLSIISFTFRGNTQDEFEKVYQYLVARYGVEDRNGDTDRKNGNITDSRDMEFEVKNTGRLILRDWYEDSRRISLAWGEEGILFLIQPYNN